jgi:lipoate-protein ligase A
MDFLDLILPTPEENLALDEALLLSAEAGESGEVLRLWESERYLVVLGAGCRLAEEVDEAACVADGVPILRRASGGGTVLLGPGCLLFSLVLAFDRAPALREIQSSYHYILERVAQAFATVLPGAAMAGTSDLAADGRKFSGNSQQRKRTHLLHHGTLLYEFDLKLIGRYLRQPVRQPEYRARRDHREFVRNLPCTVEQARTITRSTWDADPLRVDIPRDRVEELVAEKYSREEWTRRR